jgi:multicomponent Na+:H+ antiporter subunit G
MLADIASGILLVAGALFYFAGTCGLLRFPDVYSRLHALTKIDNLGLGLVVIGLALQGDSAFVVAKLLLIWGLVLAASATAAVLIAGSARAEGVRADGIEPAGAAARPEDR